MSSPPTDAPTPRQAYKAAYKQVKKATPADASSADTPPLPPTAEDAATFAQALRQAAASGLFDNSYLASSARVPLDMITQQLDAFNLKTSSLSSSLGAFPSPPAYSPIVDERPDVGFSTVKQTLNSTSAMLGAAAVKGHFGQLVLIQALLDIGAFMGVISRRYLQRLVNIAMPGEVLFEEFAEPYVPDAHAVGGHHISIIGTSLIQLYLSGRRYSVALPVVEGGDMMLLGNNFINERVASIDVARQVAVLQHHAGGSVSQFETPVTTRHVLGSSDLPGSPVAAIASIAQTFEAEQAADRRYLLYPEKSAAVPAWSNYVMRVRLPRDVKPGTAILVEPLIGEVPVRNAIRVSTQVLKAGPGYVDIHTCNISFKSETHVSELEPIARLTARVDVVTDEQPDVISLEEFLEQVHIGELPEGGWDKLKAALVGRLYYFSLGRIGCIHGVKHRIPTPKIDSGEEQPPFTPPRRMNPEQYDCAWAEFCKLRDQGILSKVDDSGYGSPIVMVKKPKGDGYRMAVDYRRINSLTAPQQHPLPNPIEILAAFGDAEWFSSLDATSAFHMVEMADKDKDKTTVSFPWGQYRYERMPFGLAGATSTFQRMMDSILIGLAWRPGSEGRFRYICAVYVDDVLVYSPTFDQHLEDLCEVLDRLGQSGALLKPSKAQLCMRQAEFTGHLASGGGTSVVPSKVNAVESLMPGDSPTSSKELKSFVCLAQYYARFIPGFSLLAAPLHAAAARGIRRGEVASLALRSAIRAIKHALQTAPVLSRPRWDRPFHLWVDTAVHTGTGAALMQLDDQGEWLTNGFYSRALSEEERRWSVPQAECSGLVDAADHWRPFLITNERATQVHTDHASLRYLLTAKRLSDVLTRQAMRLSEYNIDILAEPGTSMGVPDAIGRLVRLSNQPSTSPVDDSATPVGLWHVAQQPRDALEVHLVLLSADLTHFIVHRQRSPQLSTFSLPNAAVPERGNLNSVVTKLYAQLRIDHFFQLQVSAGFTLDRVHIGQRVFIFKSQAATAYPLEHTVWRQKGFPFQLASMPMLHDMASLARADARDGCHRCELAAPLLALCNLWQAAVANGESPVPHAPSSSSALASVSSSQHFAAAVNYVRLGVRRVALALLQGPLASPSVLLRSRPLNYAKGAGGKAVPLPLRHSLPSCNAPPSGPSALDLALSLVEPSQRDIICGELQHAAVFSSGRNTIIFCYLPGLTLDPHELISIDGWTSSWHSLHLLHDVSFPTHGIPDRNVLLRLASLSASTTSWDSRVSRLDELLNVRRSDGQHLGNGQTLAAEDGAVTEAASDSGFRPEGSSSTFHLIRTTASARRSLEFISNHLLNESGQLVSDAHLALDIEGPLRRNGHMYLVQVAVGSTVFIYDLIYSAAFIALDWAPPDSTAPPLRRWLEDPSVAKVVHGARGDAIVLMSQTGLQLTSVFDTCHVDSLLTHSPNGRSLGSVIRSWLHAELPHKDQVEHTDTLWAQRPLSSLLLHYAAEDVSLCCPLYLTMLSEARRVGIEQYAREYSCRLLETVAEHSCIALTASDGERLLFLRGDDGLLELPSAPFSFALLADGHLAAEEARKLWCRLFGARPSPKHVTGCPNIPRQQRLGTTLTYAPELQRGFLSTSFPPGFPLLELPMVALRYSECRSSEISPRWRGCVERFLYEHDPAALKPCLPPPPDAAPASTLAAVTLSSAVRAVCAFLILPGRSLTESLVCTSAASLPSLLAVTRSIHESCETAVDRLLFSISPHLRHLSSPLHHQWPSMQQRLRLSHAGPLTNTFFQVISLTDAEVTLLSSRPDSFLHFHSCWDAISLLRDHGFDAIAECMLQLSQQLTCLSATPGSLARSLGALPAAADPPDVAIIVRSHSHFLLMSGNHLEGRSSAFDTGYLYPRCRSHSYLPFHAIARQALALRLGPLESLSRLARAAVLALPANCLGFYGNTWYYDCFVADLHEYPISLHAAWRQRSHTPSDARRWLSFALVPANQVADAVSRDDDLAASLGVLQPKPTASAPSPTPDAATSSTQNYVAVYASALASLSSTDLTASYASTANAACPAGSATSPAAEPAPSPRVESLSAADPDTADADIAATTPTTAVEPHADTSIKARIQPTPRRLSELFAQATSSEPPLELREGRSTECDDGSLDLDELAKLRRAEIALRVDPPGEAEGASRLDTAPPLPADSQLAKRLPGWAPHVTRPLLIEQQQSSAYFAALRSSCSDGRVVTVAEGSFALFDGLLVRLELSERHHDTLRYQTCLPHSFRDAYIEAYHDRMGHIGQTRCIALLRESVWWPSMRRDVRRYLRRCPTCCMTKLDRIKAGRARTLYNGAHPGDVWTFDILSIQSKASKYTKLLVFIDRFSRWAEAVALEKDPTSAEVIDHFVRLIVSRHSYPRAMLCDRGSNLMRGEAPAFYESMGIRLITSDSHMHNTVGLVERFNDTLQTMTRAYLFDVDEEAQDWSAFLPYVLLAYNSAEQASTGYSPFFLLYARDAHYPIHLALQPLRLNVLDLDTYSTFVQEHIRRVHAAWHDARAALASAAAKDRRAHDDSADLTFKVSLGDRVVVRKPESHGLEIPYHGPYRVSEVLDNDRVRLRDLHSVMHDVFHISRLKLYPYVDSDGNVAPEADEYELAEITDKRSTADGDEYLVRWRGWNKTHDSWVLADDLSIAALELVAAYEAGLRVATPGGDPSTLHFAAPTTDPLPVSHAPAMRSHQEQHLDAAPPSFTVDRSPAPTIAVDHCKPQAKKQKATEPTAQAVAAPPSSDPPLPFRPVLPIDLKYGVTAAASKPQRSGVKTTSYKE